MRSLAIPAVLACDPPQWLVSRLAKICQRRFERASDLYDLHMSQLTLRH